MWVFYIGGFLSGPSTLFQRKQPLRGCTKKMISNVRESLCKTFAKDELQILVNWQSDIFEEDF